LKHEVFSSGKLQNDFFLDEMSSIQKNVYVRGIDFASVYTILRLRYGIVMVFF